MAEQGDHGIAWTETTWNPVRGCSRVSEGCRHCYAERVAARFSGPGLPYEGLARRVGSEARWTGRVVMVPEHLGDPLRWKRPRRVFVNSMSDLFHEALGDADIGRVFDVMGSCPQHTFQVLTKRAERMRDFMRVHSAPGGPLAVTLPNVWLGVSVEDQATADERIPHLLETPAAVRWVSYEPALDAVDFTRIGSGKLQINALNGGWSVPQNDGTVAHRQEPRIHWVVIGGESGPGARRFEMDWPRAVVKQCKAAGVACFMKQLGSRATFDEQAEHGDWLCSKITGKGGDPAEWPEDLRVREYPAPR